MKRDLQVGIAQWLAVPGEPKRNLQVALDMVDLATARGVELLVLPELWACGYDPVSLADDAKAAAEPRDGPRGQRLATAARAANLWLVAGSMPELDEKGNLFNTALVFNPDGDLVAWHRKAHLYPPTVEPSVFRAGRPTHHVRGPGARGGRRGHRFRRGLPRSRRNIGAAGSATGRRSRVLRGRRGGGLGRPLPGAGAGQQPVVDPVEPVRCARDDHAARRQPDCGPDRHGGRRSDPGGPRGHPLPELLVQRIDLHLAYQRDGVGTLLEEGRRPQLYVDR